MAQLFRPFHESIYDSLSYEDRLYASRLHDLILHSLIHVRYEKMNQTYICSYTQEKCLEAINEVAKPIHFICKDKENCKVTGCKTLYCIYIHFNECESATCNFCVNRRKDMSIDMLFEVTNPLNLGELLRRDFPNRQFNDVFKECSKEE